MDHPTEKNNKQEVASSSVSGKGSRSTQTNRMDPYQDYPIAQDLTGFTVGFTLSQFLGALVVIFVAIWTDHFLGGFAGQSDPGREFNWHPLCMCLGLIVLYGDGILMYRVLRTKSKPMLKLLHAGVQFSAFVLAVVGLKTVFDSHNLASPPIPNLYSLHSWIGLTTVILFALQFVGGFTAFLYPGMGRAIRARMLPLHVASGVIIFGMAILAALTGITEKLIFKFASKYSQLPNEAVVANLLGVSILLYGIVVIGLVTKTSYKRLPLPEEQILPLEDQANQSD